MVEVVVRSDQFGDQLAGHDLPGGRDDGLGARWRAVDLVQREVVVELDDHRTAADPPEPARDGRDLGLERLYRLGRRDDLGRCRHVLDLRIDLPSVHVDL